MIIVGIDDTDIIGSRGTNQLARQIVRELSADWSCLRIVRHQLLDDPRVPYTSKNGSASIRLQRRQDSLRSLDLVGETTLAVESVLRCCRRVMRDWFIEGSDPGLCLLTGECPPEVVEWGRRCQSEFVARETAFAIAAAVGVHLEALGGTEDGVIGALAAVGLAWAQNSGRIIQLGEWPDDLSGAQPVDALHCRDVCVQGYGTDQKITDGTVDVGKHLRPNVRHGAAVLFVEAAATQSPQLYQAVKLP